MAYPYNNRNVPLTDLFDPDVMGDGPTAPNLKVAGVPLRFAHIKYGSKRANVGYTEKGIDVSNKWAAKGTAQYALPIDGTVYSQNVNIFSAGSGGANLTFYASPTTYTVIGGGAGGTLTPAAGTRASGPVPTGATKVKYTTAIVAGSGGTVTNGAVIATALSGTPSVLIAQGGTGTGTGNDVRYSVRIDLYNASGAIVSTTTIYFDVSYEGSA